MLLNFKVQKAGGFFSSVIANVKRPGPLSDTVQRPTNFDVTVELFVVSYVSNGNLACTNLITHCPTVQSKSAPIANVSMCLQRAVICGCWWLVPVDACVCVCVCVSVCVCARARAYVGDLLYVH